MRYFIYYILVSITLGVFLTSCDRDDNSSIKNIEGHWIYTSTKIDILVSDPAIEQEIEDYIVAKNSIDKVSYEFKNDKTYYFYKNYAEPLKGIYKVIDKDLFLIDDSRGIKTVIPKDSIIYIISDLKEEAVQELNLDADKVIKVSTRDIFERGLFLE